MQCNCKARVCKECQSCSRCACMCENRGVKRAQLQKGRPRKRGTIRRNKVSYKETSDPESREEGISRSKTQSGYNSPTLSDVLQMFNLGQYSHNLPASRKDTPVIDAVAKDLRRCDAVMARLVFEIYKLLYSGDAEGYFASRFYRLQDSGSRMSETDKIMSLLSAMRATNRGSVERRVLRGYICATESLKRVNDLSTAWKIELGEEGGEVEQEAQQINGSMHAVSSECGPVIVKTIVDDTMMGKNKYTLAGLDWDRLIVTGSLLERKRTRDRSSDESVELLVRFDFSRKNAQLLSWGTKDITID